MYKHMNTHPFAHLDAFATHMRARTHTEHLQVRGAALVAPCVRPRIGYVLDQLGSIASFWQPGIFQIGVCSNV